jgi:hypothetical protein
MDIGLPKLQTTCHGWEYSAKTFAIAAAIADVHLARYLSFTG